MAQGNAGDFNLTDIGDLELLCVACEATDTVALCMAQIDVDGPMIILSNGVQKEHPLLKIVSTNRSLVNRVIRQLGLDVEPVQPVGRRSGGGGWRG